MKILNALIITLLVLGTSAAAQTTNPIRYNIKLSLTDGNKWLSAKQDIVFKNTSGDTLQHIYLLLMPNAYQKNTLLSKQQARRGQAQLKFEYKKLGGYIDSIDIKLFHNRIKYKFEKHRQLVKIFLPAPLRPNDSVVINIAFKLKMPQDISRLGAKKYIFQLVNWFPRIAKYQNGKWLKIIYTDINPFDAQYADFSVQITVPKQYLVIATGQLLNQDEKNWINQLAFNGLKAKDFPNPAPDSLKTLTFIAKNVNDFIIIGSDQFYTLTDSIKINDKYVRTYAFFTDRNILAWLRAPMLIDSALEIMNKWAGAYPLSEIYFAEGANDNYFSSTSINLAVISPLIKDSELLQLAIFHALAKIYARNILGISDYPTPWLARALPSFWLYRFQQLKKLGLFQTNLSAEQWFIAWYLAYALNLDMRNNIAVENYDLLTAMVNLNVKNALALNHFQKYIDFVSQYDTTLSFDSTLNEFFSNFAGKNPELYHFEQTFSQNFKSQDIDWFFNDFIQRNRRISYKLKVSRKYLTVRSRNFNKAPMPLCIKSDSDSTPTVIWTSPKIKSKLPNPGVSVAQLDPYFFTLDVNRYDNLAKTTIPKHKLNLRPHLFFTLRNYHSVSLSFIPALWYTPATGLTFGAAIHNFTLPMHRINFWFAPFYWHYNRTVLGMAFVQTTLLGHNFWPKLNLSFYIDRWPLQVPFTMPQFRKLHAKVKIKFHRVNHWQCFDKTLSLDFFRTFTPYQIHFQSQKNSPLSPRYIDVWKLSILLDKNSLFHPTSLELTAQYFPGQNLWQTFLNAEYTMHYTNLKNGMTVRLFAGQNVFLGGIMPQNDLTYSGNFIFYNIRYMRNPYNPFSHQFFYAHGGFASFGHTYAFRRLASVSAFSTIPFLHLPLLRAYGALALANAKNYSLNLQDYQLFYEYGLEARWLFLRVFLPIGSSFQPFNPSDLKHWYWKLRFSIDFRIKTTPYAIVNRLNSLLL